MAKHISLSHVSQQYVLHFSSYKVEI